MSTEIGVYESSDTASKQALKGVSGTREGNKTYLDINGVGPAYAEQIDYSGPNGQPKYHAWAVPGSVTSSAVWRIKRFNFTGSKMTSTDWADGDGEFDNEYDNRDTTISYS